MFETILNDERFRLPQMWWNTDTRADSATHHLEQRYRQYLGALRNELSRLPRGDFTTLMESKVAACQEVVNGILGTLALLLGGKRAEAFRVFFDMCLEQNKRDTGYPTLMLNPDRPLYRARKSENGLSTKGELFHIPFQKRGKVSPQRYSVPGLPCLYFGESLYGCWIELGKPPLDQLYFSRFETTMNPVLEVVDLDYNLCDLSSRMSALETVVRTGASTAVLHDGPAGGFVSKIIWWPLLAACSLQRREPLEPFHEEYLMPHLFMEYLLHDDRLAGVRYFSCRELAGDTHRSALQAALMNIAIPTKNQSRIGYCIDMAQAFRMTDPLSWRLLDALEPMESPPPGAHTGTAGMMIRASTNATIPYFQSKFFQMEAWTFDGDIARTIGPVL